LLLIASHSIENDSTVSLRGVSNKIGTLCVCVILDQCFDFDW